MGSSPESGTASRSGQHPSKLRRLWDHAEEALCAGLLLAMALLSFSNVLLRYLTDYSFAFTEELEVSGLVYLTLFGGAAAFRRGLHLGLNFVYARLSIKAQKAILVLTTLLTVAVFAAIVTYGMLQIHDEIELETLSEALEVPQWLYTLALPLGGLLIIVRSLERTVELMRKFRRQAPRSSNPPVR